MPFTDNIFPTWRESAGRVGGQMRLVIFLIQSGKSSIKTDEMVAQKNHLPAY